MPAGAYRSLPRIRSGSSILKRIAPSVHALPRQTVLPRRYRPHLLHQRFGQDGALGRDAGAVGEAAVAGHHIRMPAYRERRDSVRVPFFEKVAAATAPAPKPEGGPTSEEGEA